MAEMAQHPQAFAAETDRRQRMAALVALCALFAALAAPMLVWPLEPHADERRYTIAAAHMLAGGSWFVPVDELGELRLTKPPLTYWHVAAGYGLFGEGLAAAKAAFLASAVAIVALTYALARALGAAALPSLLAAAMIAGHRVFHTTATQTIPDMPLVLGVTVALLGAVHLLRGSRAVWPACAVWLGVAWAVLAKGFLTLLMVALYLAWRWAPGTPARTSAQQRYDRIAAASGLTLSAGWFVAIAALHPDRLVAQFLSDQMTAKVGRSAVEVLAGIGKTTTDLALAMSWGLLAVALALDLAAQGNPELVIATDVALRPALESAGYRVEPVPMLAELILEAPDILPAFRLPDAAAVRRAYGDTLLFATRTGG